MIKQIEKLIEAIDNSLIGRHKNNIFQLGTDGHGLFVSTDFGDFYFFTSEKEDKWRMEFSLTTQVFQVFFSPLSLKIHSEEMRYIKNFIVEEDSPENWIIKIDKENPNIVEEDLKEVVLNIYLEEYRKYILRPIHDYVMELREE
jgi:hypothetical protein